MLNPLLTDPANWRSAPAQISTHQHTTTFTNAVSPLAYRNQSVSQETLVTVQFRLALIFHCRKVGLVKALRGFTNDSDACLLLTWCKS